jgi:cytochrome c-type biogenesis protein CcmH
VLVRERLSAGDTNPQAIGFIVARYGNFVLLKPPLQTNTFLLWFGPALLLAGACFAWFRALKTRQTESAAPTAAPLSKDDETRLAQLLNDSATK